MENLSVTERRENILDILNEKGKVSVNSLSKQYGVSSVAIRTDLSELEKQGLLTRVHGGAITNYKSYYDMSFVQRSNTNVASKTQIAKKINSMIKNNDTLIMNAGTTPIFVMREIVDKKVTILTNSIALALEGVKNPNFKIILLGGDVDSNYQFTYGTSTIQSLEKYTADLVIMSVDGIDSNHGISTYYHHEADICRHMLMHAKKRIVAADYSKIGKTSFAEIVKIDDIDVIVTDNSANNACINALRNKNVEIIIAK